ncbi:MAG: 16S rRNA (uracil(1498)-N(3))-methyltransferase [Firmicutes bacterium]|nr:16S rRNA (uracil(1498)-N(3))-methyltransferase [Bacillota bacterium]
MIRFFADRENITEDSIRLTSKDDLKHLVRVLRAKPGDPVMISDKAEFEYLTEIESIGENEVLLRIIDRQNFATEPETEVTLYQGVPKSTKLETVVQKTVELGIRRIVPVFMARTVVADKGNFLKKRDRLQKIADEAVKQCKRGIIPEVTDAMDLQAMISDIRENDYDIILIPYENEGGYSIKDALRDDPDGVNTRKGSKVALIIGPEGGFEEDEIDLVREALGRKVRIVTLGRTILRTETAGMAALAMIMYELEL